LIIKQVIDPGGRLNFFIDFHSTLTDVFYTLSVESTLNDKQTDEEKSVAKENYILINQWLSRLQSRLPDY